MFNGNTPNVSITEELIESITCDDIKESTPPGFFTSVFPYR
jgi:hypothetical protein